MKNQKLSHSFQDTKKALNRLAEALTHDKGESLAIDGTIQRFEFTLGTFWKLIKLLLSLEKIDALSPRSVIKEAYQLQWLHDETIWFSMLDDHNQIPHIYHDNVTAQIYDRIQHYYSEINQVYENLACRFKDRL